MIVIITLILSAQLLISGAPVKEQCSQMDFIIDRHMTQFSEALQNVLDEKNSFEKLRGEDDENFIFVQGCDTIEKDLNVITCKSLRDAHRDLVKNCFKLDLVGTPLSYCIERKLNVKTVTNRCVKLYLTSTDHNDVRNLLSNNPKCLIDGFKEVCGEDAAKVVEENLRKIKYLKEIY